MRFVGRVCLLLMYWPIFSAFRWFVPPRSTDLDMIAIAFVAMIVNAAWAIFVLVVFGETLMRCF